MHLFVQFATCLKSLQAVNRPDTAALWSRRNRALPRIEGLEDRYLLASTITAAFGAGPGGSPDVTALFDDGTHTTFTAFDPGFSGGVSAVLGHVNGNAVPDVIVGAGAGGGPEVEVYNGAQLLAGKVVVSAAFMAFPVDFNGGVSLAAGPVFGTGHDDVIVGAGPGGGSEVMVFNGAELAQGLAVSTQLAVFTPGFVGGEQVAAGHVDGTGHADVVVAAGPGGGPEVEVFDGARISQGITTPTAAFMAFPIGFTGGVTVAVGAVNGTGHDDVVAAAGPGGGPEVEVFDGSQLAQGTATVTAAFMAFPVAFSGGVSVAVGQVNGTGHADVVVGAGPGGGPEVEVFDGAQLAQGIATPTVAFFAFDPGFSGGVQVSTATVPGSPNAEVIVVAGPGGGPQVNVYDGAQLAAGNTTPIDAFFAFSPGFSGGVNLGFNFANFIRKPVISPVPPVAPPPVVPIGGTTTGFTAPTVGTVGTGGFGAGTSSPWFTGGGGGGGTSGFSGTSGGFGGSGSCC